jgi:hypothetical protein
MTPHEQMVNNIPGTGVWGPWVEGYCEEPGTKSWSYKIGEWPKPIGERDVERLIGPRLFAWFAKNRKVRTTEWYNFSGIKGFQGAGPQGYIPRNVLQ